MALTGDGGDEVFGGYNKYYMGKLNNNYTRFMPKTLHNRINKLAPSLLSTRDDKRGKKISTKKLLDAISYDDSYYWDIISLGFDQSDVDELLVNDFRKEKLFNYYKKRANISSPKSLNDFMTIDKHISLEGDMLVKVDRTSMLNSLECRAPFLNKELLDFTMSLPEDYLMKKWSKKHILKKAFENRFPQGFLEKSKRGFGVPVGDWLREGLKDELLNYIDIRLLESQGIFNSRNIIELVSNHVNAKKIIHLKFGHFFVSRNGILIIYRTINAVNSLCELFKM